jgi:hypothetical protein
MKNRIIFITAIIGCTLLLYLGGFYLWIHQENTSVESIVVYRCHSLTQKAMWIFFRPITITDEKLNNRHYVSPDFGDKINHKPVHP